MKTNSNSYTIIYSVVLVLIVAFLLAFTFQALKPAQDANVALDKQKQILYSLNIRGLDNKSAAEKYKEVVVADDILGNDGSIQVTGKPGGTEAGFKLNSADAKNGKLALFVCTVNGQTKYVIPVYGMGLWGAISGYIAINDDKETVYGAYFNHESETAGLGANIKDDQSWQEQFQGKHLFAGNNHASIALAVEKNVEDKQTQVNAVTGATLTSNGVTQMRQEGLGQYTKFLNAK